MFQLKPSFKPQCVVTESSVVAVCTICCNSNNLPALPYCVSNSHISQNKHRLRWGAYKSLAQPISRCRRTELIVSSERGVCSCAELKVFSCYRGWNKHVRRRARFQQHRDVSCYHVFFFPARQVAEKNSRHSDRNIRGTCTIVCHR